MEEVKIESKKEINIFKINRERVLVENNNYIFSFKPTVRTKNKHFVGKVIKKYSNYYRILKKDNSSIAIVRGDIVSQKFKFEMIV